MTVTQPKADVNEIKRALTVLFQLGDVIELRALDVASKIHAGYFNDFDKLANEAARLSGKATGIYVVLNPLNRDLLARSQNRITIAPKNLTQDADIIRRHWLPIDIDAKRPSGISSTELEHKAAIDTAEAISSYLTGRGFPSDSILIGDSGNGAHVLVRIDLPNDGDGVATIKECLKVIAAKFDNEKVGIDQSVFNAARIWKLPGTMARKGDSTLTRPHRIARLLNVPVKIVIAPEARSLFAGELAAIVPKAPVLTGKPKQNDARPFDLETWLAKNGIEVQSSGPYENGTRYILKACPFNPAHTGTSAAVFQRPEGALGFKCQHSECANKTWADLRELKEPGYKNLSGTNGINNNNSGTSVPTYPKTDSGNAERFIKLYGNIVRYVHERKLWIVWDGNKWVWDNADNTLVMGYAKRTAREIPKEATQFMEDDEFKELLSWARSSESENHLKAMISLARNEAGVTIGIRNLNTDIYLFNVLNGTIDLHTGLLLPHNPEHFITMMAPIAFDPSAVCQEWDRFLQLIMNNNTKVIEYLRDITGYCLTGDNRTHIVPFCHGQGGNGKSTFWTIIRRIMGDYATQVDPSVFMISKHQFKDGGTREALADLFGKRLVTATEFEENHQLSINLLKAIMGGEDISGDRKYEHNIRFTPTFKVILSGNTEPIVHDSTDGAWRRLKKIPFTVKIPNPIDGYENNFMSELPGIFNWMLWGCLTWQKQGLSEPAAVSEATADYRRGQDEFNQFLEDACILDVDKKTAKKDFKTVYLKWCQDNGANPYSDKTLRQKLLSHGIYEGHSGAVKQWHGIDCKTDTGGIDEAGYNKKTVDASDTGKRITPPLQVEFEEMKDKSDPDVPSSLSNHFTVPLVPNPPLTGTDIPSSNPREKKLTEVACSGGTDGTTGTKQYDEILGMNTDQAVDIWRQHGAPVIHLGPGDNCFDLRELLSRADVSTEQLNAVKMWLQEHMGGE